MDTVARNQYRPLSVGQDFDGPLDVLGRALRLRGIQITGGWVNEGRRFHVHFTRNGGATHQHAGWAGPAAGSVLDGQLGADNRLFGAGGQGGVLGHGLKNCLQVDAAEFPRARLIGRMLGRPSI